MHARRRTSAAFRRAFSARHRSGCWILDAGRWAQRHRSPNRSPHRLLHSPPEPRPSPLPQGQSPTGFLHRLRRAGPVALPSGRGARAPWRQAPRPIGPMGPIGPIGPTGRAGGTQHATDDRIHRATPRPRPTGPIGPIGPGAAPFPPALPNASTPALRHQMWAGRLCPASYPRTPARPPPRGPRPHKRGPRSPWEHRRRRENKIRYGGPRLRRDGVWPRILGSVVSHSPCRLRPPAHQSRRDDRS